MRRVGFARDSKPRLRSALVWARPHASPRRLIAFRPSNPTRTATKQNHPETYSGFICFCAPGKATFPAHLVQKSRSKLQLFLLFGASLHLSSNLFQTALLNHLCASLRSALDLALPSSPFFFRGGIQKMSWGRARSAERLIWEEVSRSWFLSK